MCSPNAPGYHRPCSHQSVNLNEVVFGGSTSTHGTHSKCKNASTRLLKAGGRDVGPNSFSKKVLDPVVVLASRKELVKGEVSKACKLVPVVLGDIF